MSDLTREICKLSIGDQQQRRKKNSAGGIGIEYQSRNGVSGSVGWRLRRQQKP